MTDATPMIRRLGPADIAEFRAMNRLFATVFEEPDTYAAEPPDDAYVAELFAKDHVIALVARVGDRVAGALVAYELDKFERARREIYIYDLAVAVGDRRRGIATALIAWVQRHAAERGAWVVFVQADPPDLPAVALYDGLGTRESVFHFDLPPKP